VKDSLSRFFSHLLGAGSAPVPAAKPEVALDSVAGIEHHYEQFCQTYEECYGPIVQAYRPSDVDELLATEMEGMQLADGMKILDAGCGFCGPAIWFAKRLNVTIHALTLSDAMADRARNAVDAAGLRERIHVRTGDFHDLPKLYPAHDFDRVYFLESVGYAKPLKVVLRAASEVLKPGGCVYIKDWWNPDFPPGSEPHRLSECLFDGYLEEYGYRTFLQQEFLSVVTSCGYEVVMARAMNLPNDPTCMNSFDRKVGNQWDRFVEPLQVAGGMVRIPCEVLARRPG